MSPAAASRPSLSHWLYTHNPFYAISAACLIYAVRVAYGPLEIGAINSWVMMGVLVGYTLVLSGIGVCVVRWGKVWDDARSVLLLLLLLLLAVSVSIDDLLVNTSFVVGTALMLVGWWGSILLVEFAFRATRIRMLWSYRWPLHLLLSLFFVFPWWCSPAMHARAPHAVEWTVLYFPTLAAVGFLCLLPAVRQGQAAIANNGTPWPWPWFPWTPYGVLAAAVAFRSFILSMTYGQTGNIWREMPNSGRAIAFDVIFGSYFLVPLSLSLLILVLEAALVSRNLKLQKQVIRGALCLLILAVPMSSNAVFDDFLRRFMEVMGSPVWLTCWLLLGFYGIASLRKVPEATSLLQVVLALLIVIGPQTVSLETLTQPHLWPMITLGCWLIVSGIWRTFSLEIAIGAASLLVAAWLTLPETVLAPYRNLLIFHTGWGVLMLLGGIYRDRWAKRMSEIAALLFPLVAVYVVLTLNLDGIGRVWKLVYVATLPLVALAVGWRLKQWWYYYCGLSIASLGVLGLVGYGYLAGVRNLGRPAMAALSWSVSSLLVGVLISAVKAEWVPRRMFLWNRVSGSSDEPAATLAPITPDVTTHNPIDSPPENC